MSEHTPGPWHLEWDTSSMVIFQRIVSDDRCSIATVCSNAIATQPDPEAEANARLIAAAPDMLAALEVVVVAWDYDMLSQNCEGCREAIDAARAAIAKVRKEVITDGILDNHHRADAADDRGPGAARG